MQDLETRPMPRAFVYTAALLTGVLLALAVHIALTAAGFGLTSAWGELFSSSTSQLRSALAWWAIGIAGCIGSWGATVLLRSPALRERSALLVVLGLVFFFLLAAAGHESGTGMPRGIGMNIAANLAAMALGGFTAFFTAHFAARR